MNRISEFSRCIREQKGSVDGIRGSLDPYLNNYLYHHVDALSRSYPSIQKAVGEKNFKFLARHYLLSHPPREANIDLFGSQFPEFLEERHELVQLPYIGDLGRVDFFWACGEDGECIKVASGCLKLWQSLMEGEVSDSLLVNKHSTETIFRVYQGEDLYLVARRN